MKMIFHISFLSFELHRFHRVYQINEESFKI